MGRLIDRLFSRLRYKPQEPILTNEERREALKKIVMSRYGMDESYSRFGRMESSLEEIKYL